MAIACKASFVTVTLSWDTAEVLKAYMGNFDPSLACAAARATGRRRQGLQDLLQKVEGKTDTSYTMDHSAGSYVMTPPDGCACTTATAAAHRPGRRRGHVAQRSEVSCSAHWGPNLKGCLGFTSRSVLIPLFGL